MALFCLLPLGIGCLDPAYASQLQVEVTGPDGSPLSDAVVYLEGAFTRSPAPEKPIEVRQEGKQFVPFLIAVQAGSKVVFPNKDPFSHSVYAIAAAKSFELPLFKGSDPLPPPVTFDKPGKVTLGCNIHDSMVAYIFVVDTPYLFVTGADGQAKISAPDGTYEVRIWHPRMKEKEGKIIEAKIELNGPRRLSAKLELPPATKKNSNPFGKGKSY